MYNFRAVVIIAVPDSKSKVQMIYHLPVCLMSSLIFSDYKVGILNRAAGM